MQVLITVSKFRAFRSTMQILCAAGPLHTSEKQPQCCNVFSCVVRLDHFDDYVRLMCCPCVLSLGYSCLVLLGDQLTEKHRVHYDLYCVDSDIKP